MTYNPFYQSWLLNSYLSYTCYNPQYAYPTFDSFSVLKPFLQVQVSSNNMNVIEAQCPLNKDMKTTNSGQNQNIEKEQKKDYLVNKNKEKKIKRKGRNVQKQLESAKKNCQSNLVNQFLSYFSSIPNSSPLVIRTLKKMKLETPICQDCQFDQAVILFCRQISIVNSRKERRYVNKAFLLNYFLVEKLQKYMPDILQNVEKSDILTKNQFCELFRRCCFHFFRTVSVSSVTSSAKLNPISRPEHIKRRRLIVQTLRKK